MATKLSGTTSLKDLKNIVAEVIAKEQTLVNTDNQLTESQTKVEIGRASCRERV